MGVNTEDGTNSGDSFNNMMGKYNKKHYKEIRRPDCPMSSVSAWSTAAAVRGTTARAIHESPVISAEFGLHFRISLRFFAFCLIRRGVEEVNPWTPAPHNSIPYGHLGKI